MYLANAFRFTQAKLLETTFQGNAFIEQHRAHSAVTTDQALLEFSQEIHSFKRLALLSRAVNREDKILPAQRENRRGLTSENRLLFIPGMLLTAMRTFHRT